MSAQLEPITRPLPELAECETVIERGLATFVEVGQALLRIRDERLYRETHTTFEDYCRERWAMSRSYAHRQIEAAGVVGLLPNGNTPASEAVARELAPLKDDEAELVETWRQLRAEHGDRLTAAKVGVAVRKQIATERTIGQIHSSMSEEYYTPERFVEAAREVMGGIDLDPASCAEANETVRATRYFTVEDDGLAQEWRGRVWMNPPYGGPGPKFVARLIAAHEAGDVPAACVLLSAYTSDTIWFRPLFDHALCYVHGRIAFYGPSATASSTTGSVIVYLGHDRARFAEVFADFGTVVARWPTEAAA